jgi:hypothetical protein
MTLIGACKTTICFLTAFSAQFILSGECNDTSPSTHANVTSVGYGINDDQFSMRYPVLRGVRKSAKSDY